MKSIYFILIIVTWSAALTAQSASLQVISSTGKEITISEVSISWTAGEAITGSLITSGASVTNGFQQAWPEVFSSSDEIPDVLSILVYPNPVTHLLRIKPSGQFAEDDWEIRLFSPEGRLLLRKKTSRDESVLDFGPYAAGIYLLKVSTANGKTKTYHIIKPSEHEEF